MVWAKHDDMLRILASPAALTRRGDHIGGPAGHEETPLSRCGVVLPVSFLLCEGLRVAHFGVVLVRDHAPAFSALWGPSRDNDSIVLPTSALPIF